MSELVVMARSPLDPPGWTTQVLPYSRDLGQLSQVIVIHGDAGVRDGAPHRHGLEGGPQQRREGEDLGDGDLLREGGGGKEVGESRRNAQDQVASAEP